VGERRKGVGEKRERRAKEKINKSDHCRNTLITVVNIIGNKRLYNDGLLFLC